MMLVVDKDGKPLPAGSLVFGNGYHVSNLGNGVVQVDVSGAIEATKAVTAVKGVTRWLTTTKHVSADRVTDITATQFVTKDRDYSVTRLIGTLTHLKVHPAVRVFTTTRDRTEQTHERYGRTATVEATVTQESTRDQYEETVTLALTATREVTVTKTIYVTKFA